MKVTRAHFVFDRSAVKMTCLYPYLQREELGDDALVDQVRDELDHRGADGLVVALVGAAEVEDHWEVTKHLKNNAEEREEHLQNYYSSSLKFLQS